MAAAARSTRASRVIRTRTITRPTTGYPDTAATLFRIRTTPPPICGLRGGYSWERASSSTAESFNLFNRDNQPVTITDDGFQNMAGQFTQLSKTLGISHFPAYFQRNSNFTKATNAFAPRQFQFSARTSF